VRLTARAEKPGQLGQSLADLDHAFCCEADRRERIAEDAFDDRFQDGVSRYLQASCGQLGYVEDLIPAFASGPSTRDQVRGG
jgi:hypothetical protein